MAESSATHPDTLFNAARRLADPAARRAYLDEACEGNVGLREQIEALLRAHEEAGTFLELPSAAAAAATDPDLTREPPTVLMTPGTMIGRYKLLERIGEGGYGTVFMAEQTAPVRRAVALKIIKAGMDTRQVIARFEAERQALALMDHPNIAKVFDAGVTETGRPYFVMELVTGTPITKYCDELRLTPRQRLELFVPVCHAVQHAHQKGIIHRDLKPTNVLVAPCDGKPLPKVIDFGVAKATGPRLTAATVYTGVGDLIGTPEYMSPEQAELHQVDIDTRSDIYSLGVLLYELLTGTTPIEHKRAKQAALFEVLRFIREEEPPRPSTRLSTVAELPSIAANRGLEPKKLHGFVRGEVDWIVMKALEKDRARRYETANGLARDIERYLADEPVQACPPSVVYRFRKFASRHRAVLAAATIIVALLVAGITGTTIGMVRARRAERGVTAQRKSALELLQQVQAAKTEAERAAGRAQALSGFLSEAFGAADPTLVGGDRDVKVAKVLDRAAARLSVALAGQPEAEIEARFTIGRTYNALGTYAAAVDNLRRAHELARATYGDEAEPTLRVAGALARALIENGDYRDAEPLARDTLAASKRVCGTASPVTWNAASVYAFALTNGWRSTSPDWQAKIAEALPLERELVEWIRQAPGGPHEPALAAALHSVAVALQDLGGPARLAEAEQLQREAMTIVRKHPEVERARIQAHFAYTLTARGKLDEAKREFEDAVADQRNRFGDTHKVTLATLLFYSRLLTARGDHEEAAKVYEELIGRERAGVPVRGFIPRDKMLTRLLVGLADARLGLREPDAALRAADEAIGLSRTPPGPGPELTQEAWRLRAVALCSLGRFREAEQTLAQRIEQSPEQSGSWFFRGSLLAYLRDDDAYERHCTEMLQRFHDATSDEVAQDVVKTYLLVPRTPEQCEAVASLVERVVNDDKLRRIGFPRMLKGLAEYRAGHFDAAIEWLDEARRNRPTSKAVLGTIELLLALSHHRRGDADAARAALDRATEIIETHLPAAGSGGAVDAYWLVCHSILREAMTVLSAPARPD